MVGTRSKLLGIENEGRIRKPIPRRVVVNSTPEEAPQPIVTHRDSLKDVNTTKTASPDKRQMNGLKLYERFSNTTSKTVYPKQYTKETVTALIKCITVEKMSVSMASKTVHMSKGKAHEYYKAHLADPEHKIPDPSQKPKSQCHEIEELEEEHIQFIKEFCEKNKGVHVRVLQDAFHAHFPRTRVMQRVLLPRMNKKRRAKKDTQTNTNNTNDNNHTLVEKSTEKKATNRSYVRKLEAQHSEFIANLFLKEPGISFTQVRTLLMERFPGLNISKAAIQIHVHRHLKEDIFSGSINSPKYLSSKKLGDQHVDFIRKLYEERPKMPFPDVYKELIDTYPALSITFRCLRRYLIKYHTDLYKSNKTTTHKLYSKHTGFLKELYEKNPNVKLKQAQEELMGAFPGLSITRCAVRYHLKHKCGIDV